MFGEEFCNLFEEFNRRSHICNWNKILEFLCGPEPKREYFNDKLYLINKSPIRGAFVYSNIQRLHYDNVVETYFSSFYLQIIKLFGDEMFNYDIVSTLDKLFKIRKDIKQMIYDIRDSKNPEKGYSAEIQRLTNIQYGIKMWTNMLYLIINHTRSRVRAANNIDMKAMIVDTARSIMLQVFTNITNNGDMDKVVYFDTDCCVALTSMTKYFKTAEPNFSIKTEKINRVVFENYRNVKKRKTLYN